MVIGPPIRTIRGLSPRLRGNEPFVPFSARLAGSIPALAGERARSRRDPAIRRVYPRACGGTPRALIYPRVFRGLSPRLRGNADYSSSAWCRKGSIPALAGERCRVALGRKAEKVYPRACGGTLGPDPTKVISEGLSPRLRGNAAWGFSDMQ